MALLILQNETQEIPVADALTAVGDLVEHVPFPDGSSILVHLEPDAYRNLTAEGLFLMKGRRAVSKVREIRGNAVLLSRDETRELEQELPS
jgi:hypothetical protein